MNDFDVLEVLRNIKGLKITCSSCEESFSPQQARLFDIRKTLPKSIESTINSELSQLKRRLVRANKDTKKMSGQLQSLTAKKKKFKKRKIQRPKEIQIITQRINIGQIIEKILPATTNFRYETKDCRALLTPIDYIAFNGLSENDRIDKVSFIEVKTGSANLQKSQKQVKKAIEAGNLEVRLF